MSGIEGMSGVRTAGERRSRLRRRARRPEVDGSVLRWPGAAQRFALFGEVLWVGLLMALVCLPVITWPAAVAAGSAHLRRFVHAEATPVSLFFRDVLRALPGALGVGAATAVLTAVVAADLVLVALFDIGGSGSGAALPGAALVAVVVSAVGAAVLLLTLVAASLWSPGTRWRDLLRVAPRVVAADPSGAAYTAVAVALAAVVTWQFLPLGIPVLGMLAFALVAIGERRLVRLTARRAATG